LREPVLASHSKVHGTILSSESFSSQEIMTSSQTSHRISRIAFATTSAVASVGANAAFASQGPGGGPGAASSFTQLAMTIIVYEIIVYETAALLVGAGLIGAARRR
jgi:hypothetical protein